MLNIFTWKKDVQRLEELICFYENEGPFLPNKKDFLKVACALYDNEGFEFVSSNYKRIETCIVKKEDREYQFVVKNSWEGGIKEGIGQELYNIISGKDIKYLCNKLMFASEYINGKNFVDLRSYERERIVSLLIEDDELLDNYCIFREAAYILNLTDRNNTNIRISEDKDFIHIDFGFIFNKNDPYDINWFKENYAMEKQIKNERLENAINEARKKIYKNIMKKSKKMEKILNLFTPKINNKLISDMDNYRRKKFRIIPSPKRHVQQYAERVGWVEEGEDLFKKLKEENGKLRTKA